MYVAITKITNVFEDNEMDGERYDEMEFDDESHDEVKIEGNEEKNETKLTIFN